MTTPEPEPAPIEDSGKLPWPGEELVHRVTGRTDREGFYTSGRQSVRDLEALLSLGGRRLSDYPRILDFGTGCGRVMLWLEHVAATSEMVGVDIDERAVEWSRHHMPWATFGVSRPLPPLEFPDGRFDLVYGSSVFTHLDEDYQDQWLTELRRVVRPGGHLVLSVHGERAFRLVEENVRTQGGGDAGPVRRELGAKGISFTREDVFAGGPFPDFYHSTFHAPWYVFEHWGRWFDVVAYVPGGSLFFQDLVLLERPVDDARPEPITVLRTPAESGAVTVAPPTAADGLERAGRLLHEGFHPPPARGAARTVARLLVERAVRARSEYQRRVDEALFGALHEQRASHDQRTTGTGGVPLNELNARLWDALRLQGERVNRLEADVREALRSAPRDRAPDPPTG